MLIEMENVVSEKYSETEIGYLVAQVTLKKNDLFVESLKISPQICLLTVSSPCY